MTATQGYLSSEPYDSTNLFAQSGRNIAKDNDFKALGKISTHNPTIHPQQTEKFTPRCAKLDTLNATNDASFFDFEPASGSGSPYLTQIGTPGFSSMSNWDNDLKIFPMSPPESASFSPDDWPHNFQRQTNSNLLTSLQSCNTHAQHGQVTPPDDGNDTRSPLDYQLPSHENSEQSQPSQFVSPPKKRKRTSTSSNNQPSTQQPTKHTRKYASRGSNSSNSPNSNDTTNSSDPNKPDEARRYKFLERNRVAASKCRQKKKEWTNNLEFRARELQKNNRSLRMMVDSVRQEILFLKGEMLKHNDCDCSQIQAFMKNAASSMTSSAMADDTIFKKEHSPFESMPVSRVGSVGVNVAEDGVGPEVMGFEGAAAEDVDEGALEALLTSSINHDTSEEGIASKVGD